MVNILSLQFAVSIFKLFKNAIEFILTSVFGVVNLKENNDIKMRELIFEL